MASSWTTSPHLRPSVDAESSEYHPRLLAHNVNLHVASSQLVKPDAEVASECMRPLAVSAAQISVKIREDGSPSLPSEVVLDKRPTLSAPAIVTLPDIDGPRALSDVHADVSTTTPRQAPSTTSLPVKRGPQPISPFPEASQSSMSQRPRSPEVSNRLPNDAEPSAQATQTSERADIETAHEDGSPLLKHKQAARPQPSLFSSSFKPQVLASTPTTNSQAAAPIISEASSPPTMGSPQLLPLNPPLIQSSDIERGTMPKRPAVTRSTTMKTSRTARSISTIAPSEYTDMIFEPISSWNNFWSNIFLWIILAGFLVLPSTFPNLETIAESAGKSSNNGIHEVLHLVRHVPLLAFAFTCCGVGAIGLIILWIRMRHNCIWLLNSIFIPGMFSGLSGLISTFVNIYGSQNGVSYGTTTIATIAATGGCAAICSGLALIYWCKKRRVVRDHELENERLKAESEGGGGMGRITSS